MVMAYGLGYSTLLPPSEQCNVRDLWIHPMQSNGIFWCSSNLLFRGAFFKSKCMGYQWNAFANNVEMGRMGTSIQFKRDPIHGEAIWICNRLFQKIKNNSIIMGG
jgi:hypothetical protein